MRFASAKVEMMWNCGHICTPNEKHEIQAWEGRNTIPNLGGQYEGRKLLGAWKGKLVSEQRSGHKNCLTSQAITTSQWKAFTHIFADPTPVNLWWSVQGGCEMRSTMRATRLSFHTNHKSKLVSYKPEKNKYRFKHGEWRSPYRELINYLEARDGKRISTFRSWSTLAKK